MYLRRSAVLKYLVLAPLGIAVYCEWIVYVIQPFFYQDLECSYDDKTCTKVLFIADPQIQGDSAVPPPLNYIFNWDSDRYLRSTFSVVLQHFKPDVLVFLGDLMDEGSISTIPQFHKYVKRILNIFDIHYPVVQVWLPGDNDIGGEYEPIKKDKVAEFERAFQQPQVITYRNISFYKVNAITHSIPEFTHDPDATYKIVVSHYPVISKSIYGRQVDAAIHPNIYFCAHDHESKYMKQSKDFMSKQTYPFQYGSPMLNLVADEDWLYEIYVPTCSYRMGTDKMGYGAAVLENHNQYLRYTVFWSPQRFPHLYTYLFVSVVLGIFMLSAWVRRIFSRSMRFDKRDDGVPLLHRI
ncbi:uncharacterized protein Mppe [Epargyreus clarus]|uniref:uncharacterized protein Mppe n=1 Tax=Epargyreus clarus TaxID=520877 RepID=UPI003C2BEC7C